MESKQVLVTLPVEEHHKKRYEEAAPGYVFRYIPRDQVKEGDLNHVNIVVGNVVPKLLANATQLEWIQLNSAGADSYMKEGVLRDDVLITNASGAYGLAIAEYMLGGILMLQKNMHLYRDNMKNNLWKDEGEVYAVWNSKTLVIGLGDIGNEFAKRMHALGSEVYGIKKHPGEVPDHLHSIHTMGKLESLLPLMDYVAITLPGQKQLYHFFGKQCFEKMKPSALFLNVGRGNLVNTEELCAALTEKKIRGAVIDVTDPEPLHVSHPLWQCENLILTPHISGGYHLKETLERIIHISIDNMSRFNNGKPLMNQVDIQTGYRYVEGRVKLD